jgi:hypothetical protein
LLIFLVARLQRGGDLDHALGCIIAAVQDHILDTLAQLGVIPAFTMPMLMPARIA